MSRLFSLLLIVLGLVVCAYGTWGAMSEGDLLFSIRFMQPRGYHLKSYWVLVFCVGIPLIVWGGEDGFFGK